MFERPPPYTVTGRQPPSRSSADPQALALLLRQAMFQREEPYLRSIAETLKELRDLQHQQLEHLQAQSEALVALVNVLKSTKASTGSRPKAPAKPRANVPLLKARIPKSRARKPLRDSPPPSLEQDLAPAGLGNQSES